MAEVRVVGGVLSQMTGLGVWEKHISLMDTAVVMEGPWLV